MTASADDVEVNVGRIGRAHGVRGEVVVSPRTDDVERRFAPGAVLGIDRSGSPPPRRAAQHPGTLTVVGHRRHAGRLLVRFAGIGDRTAAEAIQGLLLVCHVPGDERPDDAEEFYDRHLVGLRVLDASGVERGRVSEVLHPPAQDVLEIATPAGRRLVPFVIDLVPTVDLAAGLLRLADVAGLLDDAEESAPPAQDGDETPARPGTEQAGGEPGES